MRSMTLSSSLVLGALLLTGCKPAPPKEPPVRPVRWASIGIGGGDAARTFPGILQAGQQSALAFRVSGSLKSLSVKNGSRVEPGNPVAELEQTDHLNRVEQATAQLRTARSQLDIARPKNERAERLYQSNTVSLADYQAARGAHQAARAQVQVSSKSLEAARNQLAYTTLEAPYAGVVSLVHVELGEVIGAGVPVITLSSGDALEVQAEVPESLIAALKVGAPLGVLCAATGERSLPATVSELAFTASQGGGYPLVARLTEAPAELRPGMAASVSVPVPRDRTTLRVPVAAVAEDGNSTYVWLLEASGPKQQVVRKQEVVLGDLDGEGFALREGLKEGDRVVTAGLRSLFDGMQVRLLEPAR